jgi:hypothetical protein
MLAAFSSVLSGWCVQLISYITQMPESITYTLPVTHPLCTPKGSPGSNIYSKEPHTNPADIRTGYPRSASLRGNHSIICFAEPVRSVKMWHSSKSERILFWTS